jgi:hypothetical protein
MVTVGSLRGLKVLPVNSYKVDRTTPLGNPFFMESESLRDEVCNKFEAYFKTNGLNAPTIFYLQELLDHAKEQDIKLLCWCHPKRCHADTIANYLNEKLKEKQNDG